MKANALIMAALAMSGENFFATGSGDNATIYLPPEPKAPKGSKEYFFNAEGEFSTAHIPKGECVFQCFAINDKNAIRKFKNRNK